MCGILCVVTPSSSIGERFTSGNDWTASTRKDIDAFIGSTKPLLSVTDQQKISHHEALRKLYQDISFLKLDVKLANSKRTALVDEKQKEINALIAHPQDPSLSADLWSHLFDDIAIQIARRGPDHLAYRRFATDNSHLHTFSSVLLLRQPFTRQPVKTDRFVLQFNGELYNKECLDHGNDTALVLEILHREIHVHDDARKAVHAMATSLEGEFAFVLSDLLEGYTYFGRDPIGRRSLVYYKSNDELYISSVCPPTEAREGFIECPPKVFRFHHKTKELDSIEYEPLPKMAGYSEVPMDTSLNDYVAQTHAELAKSVRIRQHCIEPLHDQADHSLAILFSGGLDCTLIAALVCENARIDDSHLNLDLLTVGFDNARTGKRASESPDRQLAIKSWFNLSRKYQSSKIRIKLVEFDVSYHEWLAHREYVRSLMFPSATEMDLSIAIAFYFASQKGLGQCTEFVGPKSMDYKEYMTQEKPNVTVDTQYLLECKVLLSGLGADELFAGYTRHEAQFTSLQPQSDSAIIEQCYNNLGMGLQEDLARIHHRNLGRDDRVIAAWGKEVRYPFLDTNFIRLVCDIPANLKFRYDFCITRSKRGERQVLRPVRKYLLRELAASMGLVWVQHEPKRAIQFGAKLAKMELGLGLTKGHDFLL